MKQYIIRHRPIDAFLAQAVVFMACACAVTARTLDVGEGQTYPAARAAVEEAQPGDTVLLHAGTHAPDQLFYRIAGTAAQWIVVRGQGDHAAVFSGGVQSLLLDDPAYIRFENIVFEKQSANGVHIHDGDTYETPAHHIAFESCWFRDIAGTGNNDHLKVSGLDYFTIENCLFINGAHGGGSAIDMVGCHEGIIRGNEFINQGNPVQTKGGSRHIRIEANLFKTVTMRGVNIGGSTDLEYFRPHDAGYEAADIQVYSNIFIDCTNPICYVGSTGIEVVNNTIYAPKRFVIRILQETVDPSRFLACGNGIFRNNIIAIGADVSTECNIGPDTDPESFIFSNNLWFGLPGSSWSGPRDIPVPDNNSIVGQDPGFMDPDHGNFSIPLQSPAQGMGYPVTEPKVDFARRQFSAPRTIGALEVGLVPIAYQVVVGRVGNLSIYSTGKTLHIEYPDGKGGFSMRLVDLYGRVIARAESKGMSGQLSIRSALPGTYLLNIKANNKAVAARFILTDGMSYMEFLNSSRGKH